MNKNKFSYFLEKEKRLILIGLMAGVIMLAIYLLAFYVPVYTSTARVYIRNLPQNNIIASYGAGSQVRSESGYSNPLFNYLEILNSGRLADGVYDVLKEKTPHDLQKLSIKSRSAWHHKFVKLIQAKVVPSTDIIKINFEWDNPKTTDFVFNTIIDQYRRVNLQIHQETDVRRSNYLQEQLTKVTTQLDDLKTQIKNYRLNNNAYDVVNENTELTKARVDLEKQAEELRSQMQSSRSKLHDLSHQLGMRNGETALRASGIGNDPYLIRLNQDLATAQQKQAHLGAGLTDQHPDMIQIRSEIQSLQLNIAKRKNEILDQMGLPKVRKGLYDSASINIATDMSRVQADAISQKTQLDQLEKGINDLGQQSAMIPLKTMELEEMQAKEKSLNVAYDNLMQKLMESRLKENQSALDDNIVVLDDPSDPVYAWIKLLLKILAFLSLGALLGMAVAWIKNDIEDNWRDADEIELMTHKKVLGIIPWTPSSKTVTPEPNTLMPIDSVLGLAYAKITNSLIAASYVEEAQVISFISTSFNRKSSPIIQNLAGMLSRQGKSVIVIETDFENPPKFMDDVTQAKFQQRSDLLDVIDEINSANRLANPLDDETILRLIRAAIIEIAVGPNGQTIPYLGGYKQRGAIYDAIASKGFRRILDVLRQGFEFILVDTPAKPFLYPEVQNVANVAQSSVIITAMKSNRQDLINIVREFDQNNNKILGVISRERNTRLEKILTAASEA